MRKEAADKLELRGNVDELPDEFFHALAGLLLAAEVQAQDREKDDAPDWAADCVTVELPNVPLILPCEKAS